MTIDSEIDSILLVTGAKESAKQPNYWIWGEKKKTATVSRSFYLILLDNRPNGSDLSRPLTRIGSIIFLPGYANSQLEISPISIIYREATFQS
jgi:hypothetical protein